MTHKMSIFDKLPVIGPRNFWGQQQYEFQKIISGMNNLFKETFSNSVYPYDIYHRVIEGKRVATIIQIAAAGFSKQQCIVNVKGNVLSLTLQKKKIQQNNSTSGQQQVLVPVQQKQYIQRKIAYRTTKLSWSLSERSDIDNIAVQYNNGILKIQIPLNQPPEPQQRTIEVQ